MILPKKKQMQPPHVSAQDGVRSDLLKAIRDGKNIIFQNSTKWCQKIKIVQEIAFLAVLNFFPVQR